MIHRICLMALLAVASTATSAQSIAVQDSFPIGSGATALCTAQAAMRDEVLTDMFDRGYAVLCRDASAPVGQIYALRLQGDDPVARLAAARSSRVRCEPSGSGHVEGLGTVDTSTCRLIDADVSYRVYVRRAGRFVYVAEGLAGYDSALRLGLRSVIADRPVPGEIEIATTGAGDPTAFARVQAGVLDRQSGLAEAYRRNNAGNFVEAAEFFAVLAEGQTEPATRAEVLVNQALQRSNLGRFAEAETLFAAARPLAGNDPVAARRYRNYFAMHLLNQGTAAEAGQVLQTRMPEFEASQSVTEGVIDANTSARLSAESPGAQRLSGMDGLSAADMVRVLDGQALHLRGVVLRRQGQPRQAAEAWTRALTELVAVRNGRAAATVWLRAQVLADLAGVAETAGDRVEAERRHREGLVLLETNYPTSAALFSAKARFAGYLLRAGRADEGMTLFREVVAASAPSAGTNPALARALAPYFALLASRGADQAAVAEMFAASQILVRPGVAQTQAVLARELSGGSDDAARLFRQSVSLTRDMERARVELARLGSAAQSEAVLARTNELRDAIERMGRVQVATQARLAEFPRYRVVAGGQLSLADLQRELRPGELYYKLTVVDDALYAIAASNQAARAYRLALTPDELEGRVNALRRTISVVRNGQQLTFPFNVELAHQLYEELFGPARAEIAASQHLIFEPDGAMLRLPPNILVMERAGVDAYRARVAASPDTDFDFRGISWLGRDRDVSTSVSARAFRDVRNAPASRATRQYLGFGQNSPLTGVASGAVSDVRGAVADRCAWPAAAWGQPISPAELYTVRQMIGGGEAAAEIVTGDAFTDTAIRDRRDLSSFRILHFATHGLVTAPRADCPPRPALMTSFGAAGSDGLLSFSEIFDLTLDADLIVLSACDTAGRASIAATEEAGLTSGGDFALDGLVRAFVGAGGRLVVASHWPVPDTYNATQRLISGMFSASPGTPVGTALRQAERSLMDASDTSHPYYWAGFALIGDGAAPVVRASGSAGVAARLD